MQIVWNEEFSDLFELGIFEQDKKRGAREPGYGGSLFKINSQKIRDAQTVFTIKKFDIVKMVEILRKIAESHYMLELQTILA